MAKCAHCGNDIMGEPFFCNECGQNYCSFHKDPIDHECNIVRESLNIQQMPPSASSYAEPTQASTAHHVQEYQQSPPGVARGTTDGTYTWFRQETQVPANAFDPDSGIKFKGILFSHLSELIHFAIASVLIYVIGFLIFFDTTLFAIGYGWTTFMLAGIYMTAFLFHEFGHRQVAKH
ncbi:MAG: AN1-type zinc finger protein, partial [Promethearchaeota archaeon]